MDSIEISEILNLSKEKKFEVTCASFDVVDHIFKIDIPKPLRNRKLAVQAMSLLLNGNIQYGYEKEQEVKLPVNEIDKEEDPKNEEIISSKPAEVQSVDQPVASENENEDNGMDMNNSEKHEDKDAATPMSETS